MTNTVKTAKFMALLLIAVLLLAGCGGNDAQDASSSPVPTTIPFPTFEFVESTNPPVFNQNANSTQEAGEDSEGIVELDPQMVERGLGRYEALECGICHGENGEGTDDITGLDNLTLTEEAFVTFMRSGGDIGSSHQYSTDRLSQNGAANLYQYLLSLSQGD